MIDFGVTKRKVAELEQRMKSCRLYEKDIEEKFVRSSGPGGQKVNKSSTCVHLTHRPSGLAVKMQKSRTQKLNRYYARRRQPIRQNELFRLACSRDEKGEGGGFLRGMFGFPSVFFGVRHVERAGESWKYFAGFFDYNLSSAHPRTRFGFEWRERWSFGLILPGGDITPYGRCC